MMLWAIVPHIAEFLCNGGDELEPDISLNDLCDEFNSALDKDMLDGRAGLMNTQAWIAHIALRWRHNGLDGVSNHQPHDCLLNC